MICPRCNKPMLWTELFGWQCFHTECGGIGVPESRDTRIKLEIKDIEKAIPKIVKPETED